MSDSNSALVIGIDISKHIDIAWRRNRQVHLVERVERRAQKLFELAGRLSSARSECIVREHTGGYENRIVNIFR